MSSSTAFIKPPHLRVPCQTAATVNLLNISSSIAFPEVLIVPTCSIVYVMLLLVIALTTLTTKPSCLFLYCWALPLLLLCVLLAVGDAVFRFYNDLLENL
jgi:hypothetical protein